MKEVRLQRAVRAQDLEGAAGECGTEREVELDGGLLAPAGHEPAAVEGLTGTQLTGLEDVGLHLLDRTHELDQLGDGVGRLLEDDVPRLAEHPVGEVVGVQLAQGDRECDANVVDPSDLTGADPLHEASEGGVVDVVVVDRQGQVALGRERTQLLDLTSGECEGLLHEHTDPALEQAACEG